jgi:rhamnose utilization protein RhaD (predicted bifunctional aldolase and dehydrogenase)
VKDEVIDLFGDKTPVLYVKGSGWDLGTIEAPGFPAVRMREIQALRRLDTLSDPQMMNALRTSLVDSGSPDPSVEALLHALLPHRFIDHTHADAILTLTNQPKAIERLREIYGAKVAFVPYVMPGFQLAKSCAEIYERNPDVEGLILLKHGIFTFGATAKESYDRMIRLVQMAEEHIYGETGEMTPAFGLKNDELKAEWILGIRREYLKRGFTAVLRFSDSQETLFFVNHPRAREGSQRGPATPDHVIRTVSCRCSIPCREFASFRVSESYLQERPQRMPQ